MDDNTSEIVISDGTTTLRLQPVKMIFWDGLNREVTWIRGGDCPYCQPDTTGNHHDDCPNNYEEFNNVDDFLASLE